jgi:hypothetical protein
MIDVAISTMKEGRKVTPVRAEERAVEREGQMHTWWVELQVLAIVGTVGDGQHGSAV